jgi:SAM-dependent methyltransferase
MEDEQNALYADPSIYDILHASGTADDVDALQRIEACFCAGAPNRWLEPACGSGRYLRLAVRRGKSVVGFDLEERMIVYAQESAERRETTDRQHLFVADMRSFADKVEPQSIGLAFNLINTIRHLETDHDLIEHFEQVGRCLDYCGVYAVGISLSAYGLEMPSEDVWTGKRGQCEVSQVINYIPPTDIKARSEQIYSHLTVTRPSGEEHIPSSYELRTYNEQQWRDAIEKSMLKVIGIVDQAGDPTEPEEPGYAIWVLALR